MPYTSIPAEEHAGGSSNVSDTSEDIDLTELNNFVPSRSLTSLRLLLLTCPNFGLQISWLLLMSYGTPFLHSLGISDSVTALVWLAGPLSGAFFQPIFGTLSDHCNHPWGRRKPFILCGASSVVLCLLALACTEDLTGDHVGIGFRPKTAYGVHPAPKSHLVTQLLAVFWVCAINISIQPFQSGVRALIVDNCPPHQQVQASAWCTRWNGLGSVFISFFGFSDTTQWAPFLGQTQFKALGVVATVSIAITVSLVCILIEDRPSFREEGASVSIRVAILLPIKRVLKSVQNLPPNCRQVCKIQFAAWFGWFPVLYYTSTFIYQTFIIHDHVHLGVGRESGPEEIGGSDYRLIEVARGDASFAVFMFAVVALLTSIGLPLASHATKAVKHSQSQGLTTILGMPLSRIWELSHLLLAACMFTTFVSWTVPVATGIVAVAGISWAVASWVPFAIISFEISQAAAERDSIIPNKWQEEDVQTAAILGLQNMAISVPQIISALVCAMLFKIFERADIRDGAAWVFRLSGCATCIAAYLTKGLNV